MQNISSLGHSQFVTAAQRGALAVTVHRKLAARVMRSSLIPDDYKMAFKLWSWIWISLLPAAAAIGYYYSWWLTPAVLCAIFAGYRQTANNSAAQYVFDYARESELFYDIMVQLGIMMVHPRAGIS